MVSCSQSVTFELEAVKRQRRPISNAQAPVDGNLQATDLRFTELVGSGKLAFPKEWLYSLLLVRNRGKQVSRLDECCNRCRL